MTAADGPAALDAIERHRPALVVLDLMLPELDGRAVIRAVRRDDEAARHADPHPVSARGSTIDRIAGLEDGADDYLPKPFSPAELVLRVKSILRRTARRPPPTADDRAADRRAAASAHGRPDHRPDRHEVPATASRIDLTRVEFRLLRPLLEADGRVLTRDQLLDAVYGQDEAEVLDRTIDVHVGRLRDKLGDDADAPRYVATVRGVGLPARADADRPLIGRGIATPDRPRGARRRRPSGSSILAVGVAVVGADVFTALMVEAGDSAEHARDDVRRVGHDRRPRGGRRRRRSPASAWPSSSRRMLARPLAEIGAAARRIADGDYAARVPRDGPGGARQPGRFVQPDGRQPRAPGGDAPRLHRQRRPRAADAADEPAGLPRGAARRRHRRRPGDLRVALGRGRPTRPAVALARRPGRGRRGDRRRRALEELDLAAADPAAARARRSPSIERAGLTLGVDVPATPARPGQPGPPGPGPRQPALERRALHAAPAARSRSAPSGGRRDLLVSIANTGEGIPPEDLDRVFERFYRVEKSRDRARGGAGIGLAIVKQLVEAGGGRVGAESGEGRPGSGSASRPEPAAHGQADRDHPDRDAGQPEPLDRLQPLAEERHGDDDRDRRPERRRQPDQPGRRDLEPVGERHQPEDVEHAGEDDAPTTRRRAIAGRRPASLALEQRRGRRRAARRSRRSDEPE